jgi:hypothetical protein
MVPGRTAIPFFQRAELGQLKTLPKEIQRLSVNQMAEFVRDDAQQGDASNVERRIWAPSRPVIHLAAAAAIVGQKLSKSGGIIGLAAFCSTANSLKRLCDWHEELEALIAKDPKFPVKADPLVRFRLS